MRQVSAARRVPAESCLSLKDSFPRALAYAGCEELPDLAPGVQVLLRTVDERAGLSRHCGRLAAVACRSLRLGALESISGVMSIPATYPAGATIWAAMNV